ncbi:Solute carrier family 28 member 3 [Nymphon striatum]|nr:Solute carrier family 28 member 3 [Nymphon striatum]
MLKWKLFLKLFVGYVIKEYESRFIYSIYPSLWFEFTKFSEINQNICFSIYFRIAYSIVIAAIAIFLIIDAINDTERLISASGVLVMIFFCFIFSTNPSKVKWRPVIWGLLLQFIFALIILRWNFGKQLFACIGDKITTFLNFTDAGSSFVFGYLVTGQLKNSETLILPKQFPTFAFKVLPVVIFFNAVTAILYYLGIMQVIVKKVGWLLKVTVGTTAAESMNAAANIFLGMTEAPLVIAPFLPKMTKSEFHSVMSGGFATIAGGVMAAYINFGIKASHLLSASVMSAPAALGISKLLLPETEESLTSVDNIEMVKCEDRNMLEAATRGATQSIKMLATIVVNLIAFLSFIAFLDAMLSWFGGLVDYPQFSFELILSKLFVPLTLVMGVELKDCEDVARLIGLKTIVNEFVAYARLGEMIKAGKLSARSETIATYALCGFSNIASIGIQIGALSVFAPNKKSVLASVAVRAMISGSIACFLTGCIAGTLIPSAQLGGLLVNMNATINATFAVNTTDISF